jgi:glycosyltransferase involved in cell wall biosynthesis
MNPEGLHLLVAMPALNEQQTIADVIRAIPAEIPGIARISVLVVNDGSTDSTASLARAEGATVISHNARLGLSRAFGTIIRHARETAVDLLVTLDADGQFDPADIPALLEPILIGRADFTTASRFKDPSLMPRMPAMKLWGNRQVSRLVSRLAGLRLHDVSCGMRAYTRDAILRLNLVGNYTYTHEVILTLAYGGFAIEEVPISVRGQRQFGQSRIASNLWQYALQTSRIILLCYRDHRPLAFFGRLAAALCGTGFLMVLALLIHYLVTGAFSPHKWLGFTGAALFAFGAQALLLGLVGDMLRRHRIYLEDILYELRRHPRGQQAADRFENATRED